MIIAVLLVLIALGSTALGFYYLGISQGSNPKDPTGLGSSTATNAIDSTESNSGIDVNILLIGLRGSSGSFDSSKVKSTLTNLLGKSEGYEATDISLVDGDQVNKNNLSGADAVQTYLSTIADITQVSRATQISDSAIGLIINSDLYLLGKAAQTNLTVLTKLQAVETPIEARPLQRKYLTLFSSSVEVLDGERAMLDSGNINNTVLDKALSLIKLSEEIDSDTTALKQQLGLK